MRTSLLAVLFTGLTCVAAQAPAARADAPPPEHPEEHTFTFRYEAEISPRAEDEGPVDVFIPLATTGPHQTVHERTVTASVPGEERVENAYANRFWHGRFDNADGKTIRVVVEYVVTRRAIERDAPAPALDAQRDALDRFLRPNRFVPTDGPVIDAVREQLPAGGGTVLDRARIIFDYVVENMEYKKVGDGWGRGDAIWACTQQYGNCTDFHALFISLARAESIPTRFEIGFPVPLEGEGDIAGYHCWLSFLDGRERWTPVDASDAWKNPERVEDYFAAQPPDRILFTVGRDLELGEGHTTGPLNYFIYPHAEQNGEALTNIRTAFRFTHDAGSR